MIKNLISPSKLNNDNQNFNCIDITKFLCAIAVFLIHIPLLQAPAGGELSTISKYINFFFQKYICRLAVPFYFVCSGFFLFKKMSNENLDIERVKNYCFKLFRLLGTWSVLLFLGWQGHLWYLGATIVAVSFLSILIYHHIDLKWMILIACAFYILGLLGDSYFGLIKPFVSDGILKRIYDIYTFFIKESRNGFFMGYIFVLIGYLFSLGKIKLKPILSFIALCCSLIGLFLEVILLQYNNIPSDYNMYIFLLPSTFFLFAFVSSISLKNRPIYKVLRTVGVFVYFIHLFIDSCVGLGMELLYTIFGIDIYPLRFFISITLTILIAFVIERMLNKEKFKWLKCFLA